MIVILIVLRDQPLRKWPLGLTLNTILSKVASAALILPISEAIGGFVAKLRATHLILKSSTRRLVGLGAHSFLYFVRKAGLWLPWALF